MIRSALRGLRGRLLLSLVATSALTLVVAAAITIGPMQSRLRDQSETALQETTEATQGDFETALSKTKLRDSKIEHRKVQDGGGYAGAERDRRQRRATELAEVAFELR